MPVRREVLGGPWRYLRENIPAYYPCSTTYVPIQGEVVVEACSRKIKKTWKEKMTRRRRKSGSSTRWTNRFPTAGWDVHVAVLVVYAVVVVSTLRNHASCRNEEEEENWLDYFHVLEQEIHKALAGNWQKPWTINGKRCVYVVFETDEGWNKLFFRPLKNPIQTSERRFECYQCGCELWSGTISLSLIGKKAPKISLYRVEAYLV